MKTLLFFAAALCALSCSVFAQIPKYFKIDTTYKSWAGFARQAGQDSARLQTIYYPGDFPAAPSGNMTNLYFRIGNGSPDTPVIIYDWKVRIGYTTRTQFVRNTANQDTFSEGLPVVSNIQAFKVPRGNIEGVWIKVPLTSGNFYYDKLKNFIVEVSRGASPLNGFSICATTGDAPRLRSLTGTFTSSYGAVAGLRLDFGFDLATTSIEMQTTGIQSVGIFPNPSQGRFTLTSEAVEGVHEIQVTVRNMLGQPIFLKQFPVKAGSLLQDIDLEGVSSGLYVLEISVGGAAITRRIVLQ